MEPRRDIRIGHVVLRKQPPVTIRWCGSPTSKNAHDATCAYRNAACGAGTTVCGLCRFPFCDTHYPVHSKTTYMPSDVWREILRRRKQWHDRVAANPKNKPKVSVDFPDEDPAVGGSEVGWHG